MADNTLQQLWGFDHADLASNRQGKLHEKQGAFLAREHKTQSRVFLGVGGLVVVIFCLLPALLFGIRGSLPILVSGDLAILAERFSSFPTGGVALGFLVAFFTLPIVTVIGFYLLRATKKADISVKRAEGTARYTWGTKRVRTPTSSVRKYEDVRVLHLNLGDKKFEVKESLQDLIREGETWRVYYTSYPFKFLSAEAISKAE